MGDISYSDLSYTLVSTGTINSFYKASVGNGELQNTSSNIFFNPAANYINDKDSGNNYEPSNNGMPNSSVFFKEFSQTRLDLHSQLFIWWNRLAYNNVFVDLSEVCVAFELKSNSIQGDISSVKTDWTTYPIINSAGVNTNTNIYNLISSDFYEASIGAVCNKSLWFGFKRNPQAQYRPIIGLTGFNSDILSSAISKLSTFVQDTRSKADKFSEILSEFITPTPYVHSPPLEGGVNLVPMPGIFLNKGALENGFDNLTSSTPISNQLSFLNNYIYGTFQQLELPPSTGTESFYPIYKRANTNKIDISGGDIVFFNTYFTILPLTAMAAVLDASASTSNLNVNTFNFNALDVSFSNSSIAEYYLVYDTSINGMFDLWKTKNNNKLKALTNELNSFLCVFHFVEGESSNDYTQAIEYLRTKNSYYVNSDITNISETLYYMEPTRIPTDLSNLTYLNNSLISITQVSPFIGKEFTDASYNLSTINSFLLNHGPKTNSPVFYPMNTKIPNSPIHFPFFSTTWSSDLNRTEYYENSIKSYAGQSGGTLGTTLFNSNFYTAYGEYLQWNSNSDISDGFNTWSSEKAYNTQYFGLNGYFLADVYGGRFYTDFNFNLFKSLNNLYSNPYQNEAGYNSYIRDASCCIYSGLNRDENPGYNLPPLIPPPPPNKYGAKNSFGGIYSNLYLFTNYLGPLLVNLTAYDSHVTNKH